MRSLFAAAVVWAACFSTSVVMAQEPDQTKPDQVTPDQAKPDQAKPDQAKPDQAKPDQVKPDQAKPDQCCNGRKGRTRSSRRK
ncbi:MAG: hypothetical protein O3C40_31235 [Planctomycetota bacterium]|nr:hypothetical protein [Planctomycetota bacterium]